MIAINAFVLMASSIFRSVLFAKQCAQCALHIECGLTIGRRNTVHMDSNMHIAPHALNVSKVSKRLLEAGRQEQSRGIVQENSSEK